MITKEAREKYTPTIGIECHVQLKTVTKLFAAVGNDARDAAPNTLVSHICFGLPGALPVLNEEAVRLAARAAFALGSEPAKFSKFDRKHYFYPDLPKGYQISQYDQPIVVGGYVDIPIFDETTKEIRNLHVGIVRAHLEEDAGKNTHPAGSDYSLVDLNRAGTPLLEIVSEPEMHSAVEAKAYVRELYLRMKYADVSDCDLYLGHMRFDVNVSVSKEPGKLGIRSETKNLNSFRSVEKAVEYEIDRQIELYEKGQPMIQETRGWDEAKQKTTSQRGKEEAQDYRYMPDPDIPPVVLDNVYIADVKSTMMPMPNDWREALGNLGIDRIQIETLLEAETEDAHFRYLPLIQTVLGDTERAKFLVNWYVNVMIPLVREGAFKLGQDQHLPLENALYDLLKQQKLSSSNAKALFVEVAASGQLPGNIEDYADQHSYIQSSNEDEIAKIVAQVIADNPKAVEDLKAGQERAIGFLVGQVMKLSQGKANPALAQSLIRKQLDL